ncbi:alpha/beta hydrolase [Bordetella sp. H567]|uniref:alpha/beta hydrolase n=1 Tax=Bordetella sp. H567 TaxID=1697043 RepID=UPI000837327E|nr:alpha/beta hydrolase [Bordetella sp. H567]
MSCHPDIAARRTTRHGGASPSSASSTGAVPPHRVRFYGRRAQAGATPLVVHFHGGAFVSGSVDSPSLVPQLLADAGAVVLSVDYPLAPHHPFPSAVEAAYATLGWVHQHRQRLGGKGAALFVAGEEAGGCIAAAVALMARDRLGPPVDGQILFSPMLDASMGTASVRCAQGTPAGTEWAGGWRGYLSCPCDASHPYATPLAGTRLAGLPPLLLLSGPDDPLRDEGRAYASRLRAAGVPVIRESRDRALAWTGPHGAAAPEAAAELEAVRARLFSFLVTHPGGGARPTPL